MPKFSPGDHVETVLHTSGIVREVIRLPAIIDFCYYVIADQPIRDITRFIFEESELSLIEPDTVDPNILHAVSSVSVLEVLSCEGVYSNDRRI